MLEQPFKAMLVLVQLMTNPFSKLHIHVIRWNSAFQGEAGHDGFEEQLCCSYVEREQVLREKKLIRNKR